jgi:hypothetical protein
MLIYAGLWLFAAAYAAGVVGPRVFWVLAGRRCPQCVRGRLSFQGLVENPWRRLRSWWRCDQCCVELREAAWGRLEPRGVTANLAESSGKVAEIEAELAA